MAETGEPLPVDSAYSAGLELTPRLAVEFGLHLPDFSEVNRAVSNLETVVLREGNAVILACAFESGKAWGFALFYSIEECLERQFDAVNDILEDLTVDGFDFGMVLFPLWLTLLCPIRIESDF